MRFQHHFITNILAGIVLLAAAAPILAEDQKIPLGGIGFHYDGTGVHPDDHKPPRSWDQGEGLSSTSPAVCVPKGSKNVRWVAETPNWCYGLPVEVGERVFFMCEPGAEGMRWPTLVCLDRKTGKEQWRTEINQFDALGITGEERQKLEKYLDQWHAYWRFMYSTLRSREEEKDWTEADRQAVLKKLKDAYGYEHRNRPSSAVIPERYVNAEMQQVAGALGKVGILPCNWQTFDLRRIGASFPTPVSDGKAIYVLTGAGTSARVELDGKIGWYNAQTLYDSSKYYTLCSSPRLYEPSSPAASGSQATKLLLVAKFPHAQGLDTTNGRVVWEHKTARTAGENGDYAGVASSFVGQVGETALYFTPFGDILRPRDGKLLCSDPVLSRNPMNWSQEHAMISRNIQEYGYYGIKVRMQDDAATAEKVWGIPFGFTPQPRYRWRKLAGIHASVSYRGRIYDDGYIFDCTTGDIIAGQDGIPSAPIIDAVTGKEKKATHEHVVKEIGTPASRMHYLIANDMVYGCTDDGIRNQYYWKDMSKRTIARQEIFSLDGKKVFAGHVSNPPFNHPAMQRIHNQGIFATGFSYSGSFSIGRDALYVRGGTHLWCLSEEP